MISKRDQLIDTTCELMETQGYHVTGLNQIVAASGAPKSSLYYYFPEGKEELATEAIERSGRVIEQRIRLMMVREDDPIVAVASFIHALANQVEASGYRQGGPITAIALESASTNDRLRESCNSAYRSWQNALTDRLRLGGFSEARSQRLGSLIIAALEGGIILSRSHRSPKPLHDVAHENETLQRSVESKCRYKT